MKLNARWISIAAILLSLSACSEKGDGRESAGDKREWSILQGIEFGSRGSIPSAPELQVVEGYELLCVPSIDGSTRIWVMLRPKSPPYYKQLRDGNFMIPSSLLNDLVRGHKISSTVEQALRSHVANWPKNRIRPTRNKRRLIFASVVAHPGYAIHWPEMRKGL